MKYLNSDLPLTVPVPGSVSCLNYPIKASDVSTRDPFILNYGGTYILYSSFCDAKANGGEARGVCAFVSKDLENWSEPFYVYKEESSLDIVDAFWAPEVHFYNGYYYLITSYKKNEANAHDVIFFAKSVSPFGPFKKYSEFPFDGTDAIDGTLWVEDGKPYLVYSFCFTAEADGMGGIKAVELSDDLSKRVGEPFTLFKANAPSWTDDRVGEAPFLFSENGELYMIWSNYMDRYYVVGLAKSDNGKLSGKWSHGDAPLYAKGLRKEWICDGGHPMIFRKTDGTDAITFHAPNGFFIIESDPDRNLPEKLAYYGMTVKDGKPAIE